MLGQAAAVSAMARLLARVAEVASRPFAALRLARREPPRLHLAHLACQEHPQLHSQLHLARLACRERPRLRVARLACWGRPPLRSRLRLAHLLACREHPRLRVAHLPCREHPRLHSRLRLAAVPTLRVELQRDPAFHALAQGLAR